MRQREMFGHVQSDLYMQGMAELAPILRDAIDQVESAHSAVRDAMTDLFMVKRELDRLEQITAFSESNPTMAIRESMGVEVLVQMQIRESFVYFIEAGNFIKIGHSRDPIIRLGQIRQGRGVVAPEGLDVSSARLLAVEQGDSSSERALHKRFAEHRAVGEWFEKNDRLTYYIKSIVAPSELTKAAA